MLNSQRAKVRSSSFRDDDVSDMSSSYGETNAKSIFRPTPPASYDENELLFMAAESVLNQALGRKRNSKFDADAMTSEEELLRRIRNIPVKSHEESGTFEYEDQYLATITSNQSFAGGVRYTPHQSPERSKKAEHDQIYLMEHADNADDDAEEGFESDNESVQTKAGRRRYGLICFFVILMLCAIGGLFGLMSLILKNRGRQSASAHDQIITQWPYPTVSPSTGPTLSHSDSPSLRFSDNPSIFFSDYPSFAPSTLGPTKPPTSRPPEEYLDNTYTPSASPSALPTSLQPSKVLSLDETIMMLSPETEGSLEDPSSPQSLALAQVQDLDELDKFALLTLALSANFTMWDATTPLCTWPGVGCHSDGTVKMVDLRFKKLIGTLPPELALATNLEIISIAGSGGADVKGQITGNIPSLWGQLLAKLRVLELYDNRLAGQIPDVVFRHSQLESLHIDGNEFTGTFPTSLSRMTSLKSMDLSDNKLVGTLPTYWKGLGSLRRLSLKGNSLHGMLPHGLGELSELEELHLQRNGFTNTIPDELSQLTNLGWLALHENQLTGTIPASLGEMVKLEGLELASNGLRGSLPASIGSLSSLRVLDVSNNFLTGTIPQIFDGLEKLAALVLHHNNLHGQVSLNICESVMHIESDCNADMDCSCCIDCFIQ